MKLIELQVALPRTQDIGKIQEQANQRSQLQQDVLAVATTREQELKRKQVNKNDKLDQLSLTNKHTTDQFPQSTKNEDTKEALKEQHPYKGNIVDYVG